MKHLLPALNEERAPKLTACYSRLSVAINFHEPILIVYPHGAPVTLRCGYHLVCFGDTSNKRLLAENMSAMA
jgi:hypothetical protein